MKNILKHMKNIGISMTMNVALPRRLGPKNGLQKFSLKEN